MLWLLFTIVITSYFGFVIANMLKLNEFGALRGRVAFTFILPIFHFGIMPIMLLYKGGRHKVFLNVVRSLPLWFLLYPITLAKYATIAKPLKEKEKVNVKNDMDKYELLSENMIPGTC